MCYSSRPYRLPQWLGLPLVDSSNCWRAFREPSSLSSSAVDLVPPHPLYAQEGNTTPPLCPRAQLCHGAEALLIGGNGCLRETNLSQERRTERRLSSLSHHRCFSSAAAMEALTVHLIEPCAFSLGSDWARLKELCKLIKGLTYFLSQFKILARGSCVKLALNRSFWLKCYHHVHYFQSGIFIQSRIWIHI